MNGLLLKNLNALCIRNTFSGLLGTNGNKRNLGDKSALSTEPPETSLAKLPSARQAVDVKKYLKQNSIKNYDGWNSLLLNDYCKNHLPKNQASDPSLFVDQKTGDFFCLKCRVGGDWSRFQELDGAKSLCQLGRSMNGKDGHSGQARKPEETSSSENLEYFNLWQDGEPIETVSLQEYRVLLKNLKINFELSKKLLEAYDMRISGKKILYPVYDYAQSYWTKSPTGSMQSFRLAKIISLTDQDQDASSRSDVVFGLQSIFADLATSASPRSSDTRATSKRLFITDSLVNILILNGVCKGPAICIPSVEALESSKSFLIKALLEKYDQIIFWQTDKNLSFKIANHLNINRCFMVNYSRSPVECVSLNENLLKIVKEEIFSMQLSSVLKFENLKPQVLDEIVSKDKLTGVKWTRFGPLNKYLKGFREGELTILTGSTGSGKTTFLSEYSLDLSIQGVKTLWGSFEIKNKRLIRTMMKQFCRINLDDNVQLFDNISDEFSKLPLYFMDFHSEQTIENVIRTMSNSVLLYGIQHVIIDNLQFMIGNQFAMNIDKFTQQDLIISKFRQFATNFNCHVTLVIHPRKEELNEPLKITSVFGSAKATQEADNVIILQQEAKEVNSKKITVKYIEICKNRYDGELGRMLLKFNRDSQNYYPLEFNKVVNLDQAHRYQ